MASKKKTTPVDAAVDRMIPGKPSFVINLHSRPPVQTQDMTTDLLHQVLRSAEAGQIDEFLALIRDVTAGDALVLAAWSQRKTRLLGKPWALTAETKGDAEAEANVKFLTSQLKECTGFLDARSHLLDSTIYPMAVVEKIYARSGGGWKLAQLIPVPHDMLDYRNGKLQIKVVTEEGVPTGEVEDLDPARHIVHRGHLLRALPPAWCPARALLFYWFLAAAGRSWWSRGLERDGGPFLVGKYDPAHPEDRGAMEAAFADAVQRFGLVISQDTDVQVFKDLASGSAAAHEAYQMHMHGMMLKVVTGQALTMDGKSLGLGSDQAAVANDVLTDLVTFDDMLLAETLQEQLFQPLLRLNRRPGSPPVFSHGVVSENLKARAEVLKVLKEAGVELLPEAAGPLSDSLGLPVRIAAPSPGLATLAANPVNRLAAAELAQAFRGSLAPVRRLVLEAQSAEELQARLAEFYADWAPGRVASLTADALTAFAAQGAAACPA